MEDDIINVPNGREIDLRTETNSDKESSGVEGEMGRPMGGPEEALSQQGSPFLNADPEDAPDDADWGGSPPEPGDDEEYLKTLTPFERLGYLRAQRLFKELSTEFEE